MRADEGAPPVKKKGPLSRSIQRMGEDAAKVAKPTPRPERPARPPVRPNPDSATLGRDLKRAEDFKKTKPYHTAIREGYATLPPKVKRERLQTAQDPPLVSTTLGWAKTQRSREDRIILAEHDRRIKQLSDARKTGRGDQGAGHQDMVLARKYTGHYGENWGPTPDPTDAPRGDQGGGHADMAVADAFHTVQKYIAGQEAAHPGIMWNRVFAPDKPPKVEDPWKGTTRQFRNDLNVARGAPDALKKEKGHSLLATTLNPFSADNALHQAGTIFGNASSAVMKGVQGFTDAHPWAYATPLIGQAALLNKIAPDKVVPNAARDLIDFPAQALPSGYQLGKAAEQAVPLPFGLKESHPDAAVAMGKTIADQFTHPVKSFEEHPLFLPLMARGGVSLLGRTGGAAARTVGRAGKADGTGVLAGIGKAGSTKREDRLIPLGDDVNLHVRRDYSKDIITKAAQVVAEKARNKDIRVHPEDHPVVAQRGRPVTIRGKLGNAAKGFVDKRELQKNVDDIRGLSEATRRLNRSAVNDSLAGAIPHKGKFVKRPRKEADLVSFVARGIVRTPETAYQDLVRHQRDLQAAAKDFKVGDDRHLKTKNEENQALIQGLLDDTKLWASPKRLATVFDAARVYSHNQGVLDDLLVQRGHLGHEQARKAPLIDYAIAQMKAHYDPNRRLTDAGQAFEEANAKHVQAVKEHKEAQKIYTTEARREAYVRGGAEVKVAHADQAAVRKDPAYRATALKHQRNITDLTAHRAKLKEMTAPAKAEPVVKPEPKAEGAAKVSKLRESTLSELHAIASDSLAGILPKLKAGGELTAAEAKQLRDVLRAETETGGMLTRGHHADQETGVSTQRAKSIEDGARKLLAEVDQATAKAPAPKAAANGAKPERPTPPTSKVHETSAKGNYELRETPEGKLFVWDVANGEKLADTTSTGAAGGFMRSMNRAQDRYRAWAYHDGLPGNDHVDETLAARAAKEGKAAPKGKAATKAAVKAAEQAAGDESYLRGLSDADLASALKSLRTAAKAPKADARVAKAIDMHERELARRNGGGKAAPEAETKLPEFGKPKKQNPATNNGWGTSWERKLPNGQYQRISQGGKHFAASHQSDKVGKHGTTFKSLEEAKAALDVKARESLQQTVDNQAIHERAVLAREMGDEVRALVKDFLPPRTQPFVPMADRPLFKNDKGEHVEKPDGTQGGVLVPEPAVMLHLPTSAMAHVARNEAAMVKIRATLKDAGYETSGGSGAFYVWRKAEGKPKAKAAPMGPAAAKAKAAAKGKPKVAPKAQPKGTYTAAQIARQQKLVAKMEKELGMSREAMRTARQIAEESPARGTQPARALSRRPVRDENGRIVSGRPDSHIASEAESALMEMYADGLPSRQIAHELSRGLAEPWTEAKVNARVGQLRKKGHDIPLRNPKLAAKPKAGKMPSTLEDARANLLLAQHRRDRAAADRKAARKESNDARVPANRRTFIPGLVDHEGKPLDSAAVEKHMEEAGVADQIGFVTNRPGALGASAGYKSDSKPQYEQRYSRTGSAISRGLYEANYRALMDSQVRSQGILDSIDGRNALINRFVVARTTDAEGRPVYHDGLGRAQDAARAYNETNPTRPQMVPYAIADPRMDNARFAALKENLNPTTDAGLIQEFGPEFENHLMTGDPNGKYGLIPKVVADQIKAHDDAIAKTALTKALTSLTQRWRSAILHGTSFSKWTFGNSAELALRMAVAGINPYHVIVGRKVVNAALTNIEDAGQRQRVKALMLSGGHFQGSANLRIADTMRGDASGLRKAMQTLADAPGVAHVLKVWDIWVNKILLPFNRLSEHIGDYGAIGKLSQRDAFAMDDLGVSFKEAVFMQRKAIEQVAKGLLETPEQIRFARFAQRVVGKYGRLSPSARHFVQGYSPFGLWYAAAFKFIYMTLPAHHGVTTALLNAAYVGSEKERKRLGQSTYGENGQDPPPEFLQGALQYGGETHQWSRYTPFGALGAFPGNVPDQLLPQLSPALDAFIGTNFTGRELKMPDGSTPTPAARASIAAYAVLESMIPFLPNVRKLREGGGAVKFNSTVVSPHVTPGTRTPTDDVLKRIQLPGYKTKKPQPKGKAFNPLSPGGGSSIPGVNLPKLP